MESQAITIGLVAVVAVSTITAIGVYSWVAGQIEKVRNEADGNLEKARSEFGHQLGILQTAQNKLELELVRHYATYEHVNLGLSRIEGAVEKLINRFDSFGNSFNASLVELVKDARNNKTQSE
jgi:hypothetical protein